MTEEQNEKKLSLKERKQRCLELIREDLHKKVDRLGWQDPLNDCHVGFITEVQQLAAAFETLARFIDTQEKETSQVSRSDYIPGK
jgi:hypothetical protein